MRIYWTNKCQDRFNQKVELQSVVGVRGSAPVMVCRTGNMAFVRTQNNEICVCFLKHINSQENISIVYVRYGNSS